MFLMLGYFSPAMGQFASSFEYQMLGYENVATDNPVYRLDEQIKAGEVTLEWNDDNGYLQSLLQALDIAPSSQMLVYSPTSLQYKLITHNTPRALYFNEDVYIGYVLNSEIVEITAIDESMGMVFYIFNNKQEPETYFDRSSQVCLVCHDSQGTMGGGTPRLLTMSSVYNDRGESLQRFSGEGNIDDQSPISIRWGGWYVTGQHWQQKHLGNILLKDKSELANLEQAYRGNIDTLDGLLDTSPYLEPTSDIVALMILEHQLTVQNQITYIQFKAPSVLNRTGLDHLLEVASWEEIPATTKNSLRPMHDKLIDLMLMKEAATLEDKISGDPGFEEWFLQRGIQDSEGRSLRDLDLKDSLFQYPLSYLIYSPQFDALPAYSRDYIYLRLAAILQNQEQEQTQEIQKAEGQSAWSGIDERQSIVEILQDTKPEFVPYLSR